MHIRPATAQDVHALAALELACFPHDPWGEEALRAHLQSPVCRTLVACDAAGEIVAYTAGQSLPPEAEIFRVATLPAARRGGCARALLGALLDGLTQEGCRSLYLEVRTSNIPARSLYGSLGFREAGVRRAYYRSPREDAVILTKTHFGE